ncbi:MAG: efflux RND transporter periplasmic adaptor subunit [Bryobacterales bacterium]|nr:efflux RND transporter periplasmic adaptor subunit [Bryobacterales bacterium]MDE0625430.1 efflux RND transporter periplasmic adaptor subunit [Bryobacterales bacterium]
MNKIRLALKVVLPLFVLALGIWTAKALIDSYEPPKIEPVVVEPPLVRVVRAERTNLTLKVHAEGTVAPRTESRLVPEISGRVTEVSPSLAAGGFFDEGDVLLKLDTRVYELAITRAEEALERARLRLTVERQEAEIARQEWEALGTGEPSPLLFREPQIAEVQSSLAAAEAALEQASYDLDRTVLRAPFAGRVRSKQVDVGQFVQRGETLATLYSVDVAEVRLPIPNSELEFCDLPLAYRDGKTSAEGPGVVLKALFAGEEHSWQGRIVRTEGEIDPRTRMVNAIAQVEDPYTRGRDSRRPPLAVGMFVHAEIEGNRVRDVICLPRSAMRGENVVYVVDSRGRLRFRTVVPLRHEREVVLVREGLEEGDFICVSPMEAAVDGMTVRTAVEGDMPEGGGES